VHFAQRRQDAVKEEEMRKLVGALAVAIGLAAGAASAVAKAAPAVLDDCPNTWCAPDDRTCSEVTGWSCALSGGCVETHKCNPA
jgi:hypothetical protein